MRRIARDLPTKVRGTARLNRDLQNTTTERSSKGARMEQIYASVQARTYRIEATKIAEKLVRAMSRVEPEDVVNVTCGQ